MNLWRKKVAKFLVQKSGPLQGEVTISGAKNAVLPIMAATLLTEEKCVIKDVPALRDVDVMCQLLESMGASVDKKLDQNTVEIEARGQISYEAPFDLVKMMRASILVLGALLLRTGRAVIHLPGGCAIGKRPVELHLKGLKALGVKINEEQLNRGIVDASAEKLTGSTIYLDFPSVGATEVIMMAAALAEGTTVIENAAQEPEIVDLANFLNKMDKRRRNRYHKDRRRRSPERRIASCDTGQDRSGNIYGGSSDDERQCPCEECGSGSSQGGHRQAQRMRSVYRADGGRRSCERRYGRAHFYRYQDSAISWIPYRHAVAVHGSADSGTGAERRDRNSF